MAIENLPRPWILAALTGLRVAELVAVPEDEPADRQGRLPLPRPEARRRRRHDIGDERCVAVVLEGRRPHLSAVPTASPRLV